MLNRYFKTDGNLDFVYANMVLKNINFALVSLDYIFNHPNFCLGIYHDEHTFYFFHIQSLLTACGNISNVLNNRKNEQSQTRCDRLRQTLNISTNEFPLVFMKEVRNTNEHFDERYEEFGPVGDYNLLDENTDLFIRTLIQNNLHLRTYDKEHGIYYTYNRNKEPIEYDLNQLQRELEAMRDHITNNELLLSGWQNSMPEEKVE